MRSRFTAYFSTFTLLANLNAPLIGYSLVGLGVIHSPFTNAQTVTNDAPILDELKAKYDLENPNRNHQDGSLSESITDQMNPTSEDLSQRIIDGINAGNNASTVYDFSDAQNERGTANIESQERGIALGIGLSHGSPQIDENTGEVNVKISKEGTRKFSRDTNGELIMTAVDEGDIEYVGGVTQNDLTSNEINNSDHVFNTPNSYGDAEKVSENVKDSHLRYRDGANSTGRAYQAITAEIDRGINTTVDPDAAFLQPSKNVFDDVNSNTGDFFQSCQTSSTTNTNSLNFPTYEEFTCNKTKADNPFFCEVERKYKVPIAMEGGSLTSCGEGCYELQFGQSKNNFRDPDGCALYNDSFLLTFNLSDGIELDRVVASGYVDDHVEFRLDGQLAFSMVTGNISYTQDMPGESYGQCEAGYASGADGNGRWYMSGDKTYGFKRYMTSGTMQTYTLDINHLVGGEGEIYGSLKFYFNDSAGEGFGETFNQYPAGCLDKTGAIGATSSGTSGEAGNKSGGDTSHCTANGEFQCVAGDYYETGPQGAGCYDEAGNYSNEYQECEPQYNSGGSYSGDAYAASSITEDSFCRFDGWTPLDQGTKGFPQEVLDKMTPMYEGDEGNVTWKANLDGYRCDPLEGEDYCYIDPESLEEVCLSWEEMRDQPNQCEVYEQDESCSEIKRECTEDGWYQGDIGYTDENGNAVENQEYCFNETVTYECETNNTIGYTTTSRTSTCDAALPCVGGDCDLGETEKNEKFLEAAVKANVMQNVDGDFACEDPENPATCRIFTGEYEYCSWEVTGLGVDCCEQPAGVNILAYVTAAEGMLKANRMAADGIFGETAKQGADAVINFADSAKGYVTDSVSSVYNSVMGEATATTTEAVSDGAVSQALEAASQKLMETIYNAMPEELASQLFTKVAADEASGQAAEYALNETVSSMLNFVGAAYTAYSLVKIGLQLLTMCDENESDMGIKLAQRQCFKVGGTYCSKDVLGVCYQKRQDHCCYSSILARIIMEQGYDQLGIDPMADELELCRGLNQAEFGALDFNQIELSEWVGLLLESGEIKTEANEQILTGGGQFTPTDCETWQEEDPETGEVTIQERCYGKVEGGRVLNAENRKVVSQRTEERLTGADSYATEAQQKARDMANSLDCSVTPRPPVCDFSINPRDTDSSN